MSRTRTVVAESRPLDSVYDTTYVGAFSQTFTDKRVLSKVSSSTMVAGTSRYKYFKRPMIPKLNAVATQVLLAPATEDPLTSIEEIIEEPVKNAEVQTMFRESEAQTLPYTPNYMIPEGTNPELLLLKDLKYENGLPLGAKDLDIVEHARDKRRLESNVPPFTDEASLNLRKHLMEKQEMKELKFRENEIDVKREEKLNELKQILYERDEANEFLSAQRVEAVRQIRMEEREKVLEKIKAKRIKILRRLAHERNKVDPSLHEVNKRDIIDDHFDKASQLYAPIKRTGKEYKIERERFNIMSRTAAYVNINTIEDLESTIPKRLLNNEDSVPIQVSTLKSDNLFSKTAPTIISKPAGIRLLEDRLTSAARRDLKNTKRDIERMFKLIQTKKKAFTATSNNSLYNSVSATSVQSLASISEKPSTADQTQYNQMKKRIMKSSRGNRPNTTDITVDEQTGEYLSTNLPLQQAVILLQRIIRGRAVQNIMIEGKHRQRELIAELRAVDEYYEEHGYDENVSDVNFNRDERIRESSHLSIIGGLTGNLANRLTDETNRLETYEAMQQLADIAIDERRKLEAAEAGRRQRENMAYPKEYDEAYSPSGVYSTVDQLEEAFSEAVADENTAVEPPTSEDTAGDQPYESADDQGIAESSIELQNEEDADKDEQSLIDDVDDDQGVANDLEADVDNEQIADNNPTE